MKTNHISSRLLRLAAMAAVVVTAMTACVDSDYDDTNYYTATNRTAARR